MLVVDGEEVHRVCAWPALVAALHEAHRGPRPLIGRCALEASLRGVTQTYFNLPAFLPGDRDGHQDRDRSARQCPSARRRAGGPGGLRPVRRRRRQPVGDHRRHRADLPQDRRRQRPRLTAAEPCGRARAAPGGCRRPRALSCAARIWRFGHPWSRSRFGTARTSRRDAWRSGLRADGIGATAVAELEPAVRAADIVCCCTAATEPLLAGCVAASPAAMSIWSAASRPTMRECDDDAVVRARLFVDEASINIDACGDLIDPIRRGVIARGKVEADLYELCRADAPSSTGDPTTSLSTRTAAADISTCSPPCSSATNWAARRRAEVNAPRRWFMPARRATLAPRLGGHTG